MQQKINIRNKKASFNYELLDRYVAGIQLYGTEIKSIRLGKAGLTDSYCFMLKGELWVRMYIAEYDKGTYSNHEPRRDRKLLLTKRELQKINRKLKSTGLAVIPTKMFLTEKGLAKLEIALARGKKRHDKRESLKQQDSKREMDRMKKIH